MKAFIIFAVVVLGIGIVVGIQQGLFETTPEKPPFTYNNTYVPTEVVEETPPPFSIVPKGSSKVEIYDGLSFDKKALVVDLSGHGLSGSLKSEVQQLSELQELNLSDNDFTGLPAEVGQLLKLEILNLSNNQLTGIPRELGNLQNLKVLDLRGNDISEPDLEIIMDQLSTTTEVILDAE